MLSNEKICSMLPIYSVKQFVLGLAIRTSGWLTGDRFNAAGVNKGKISDANVQLCITMTL